MTDPNTLIEAVRDAWADDPAPRLDAIVPHICDECWAVRDRLAARPWHEVDAETIEALRWDLPFLSDDAKRHYLPLWLLAATEDPASDHAAALLFALDSDHRWQPERGYAAVQLAAIRAWLELMLDHVDDFDAPSLDRALTRWLE